MEYYKHKGGGWVIGFRLRLKVSIDYHFIVRQEKATVLHDEHCHASISVVSTGAPGISVTARFWREGVHGGNTPLVICCFSAAYL